MNDFKHISHKVEEAKVRQNRNTEANGDSPEQKEIDKTWEIAAAVKDALVKKNIKPDAQVLSIAHLAEYRSRHADHHLGMGLSRLADKVREQKLDRMVETHRIGAWDMQLRLSDTPTDERRIPPKSGVYLYLGIDDVIYTSKGSTEKEAARGVLIPILALEPGEKIKYDEVQDGLANLVAMHDLD